MANIPLAFIDNDLCGGCGCHFETEPHAGGCPNATFEIGDVVNTPYGPGVVLRHNPSFGYRVMLAGGEYWFAFWEINALPIAPGTLTTEIPEHVQEALHA